MSLFSGLRAVVRANASLVRCFFDQSNNLKRSFCKAPPPPPTVQDKLMEFFDDKNNWGQQDIQVGRSWKIDELRIKSNTDLHKLWYVLLKERNMLYTMEEESKQEFKLFPNPERIDKVHESMENIECVVKERNRAYHLLETGHSGEREGKVVLNQLGIRIYHKFSEHCMPAPMNVKWRKSHVFSSLKGSRAVWSFRRQRVEQWYRERQKARNRDRNHVIQLIKRFPNMDFKKLKEAYPNVNIKGAQLNPKSRGHYVPKALENI